MPSFITYLWSLRRQFAKYFLVGISGFVLDLGSLIFFKRVLGLGATTAVVLNQPIVLVYNFALNKWWSFRNHALPHWQLVRYLCIAGGNYIFSVTAMHLLHDQMSIDYRLARVMTVAAMVPVNFWLYKHWVYTEKSQTNSPS
ncbi:MAG: GtrA family protein [Patescibacteria group bacterium]